MPSGHFDMAVKLCRHIRIVQPQPRLAGFGDGALRERHHARAPGYCVRLMPIDSLTRTVTERAV